MKEETRRKKVDTAFQKSGYLKKEMNNLKNQESAWKTADTLNFIYKYNLAPHWVVQGTILWICSWSQITYALYNTLKKPKRQESTSIFHTPNQQQSQKTFLFLCYVLNYAVKQYLWNIYQ